MSKNDNDHDAPAPEPELSGEPAAPAVLPEPQSAPEFESESESTPVSAPEPQFGSIPRRDRVRWINPRRRVAAALVAFGIAIVGFGAGIGTVAAVSGASHHTSQHERIDRVGPRDGGALPGPPMTPKERQFLKDQRKDQRNGQRNHPQEKPTPGTAAPATPSPETTS
ncbi:MAG: hypothetical protein ABI382_08660 [Nakamurella sp.]